MATLRGAALSCKLKLGFRSLVLRRDISTTAALTNWNRDWKPGPFPVTAEERAAAAKKYGLRVEDYDVYDNDGMGYGDYPKLPLISGDAKDPYEDWDIPEMKRNYGEPVHALADIIGEDRWDCSAKPRYSYTNMFLTLVAVVGGMGLIYELTEPYPHFLPVMPKQYPFNELYLEKGGDAKDEPTIKHYTFEPAD